MYHKQSLFPLAIIFLTLALAGLMIFVIQEPVDDGSVSSVDTETAEEITVDPDVYREDLAQVLSVFETRLEEASDDLAKLVATETAQASLLALRVPVEYKELHLDLVIVFNDIQSALRSADRSLESSLADLEALKVTYPWL